MAFTTEEIYFKSAEKNTDIYARFWIPDNIKLILQIAHGMVEHINRYDDFAKFLNKHNILVVGNDHLGHGNSVSSPEQFGYFSNANGNDYLISDMYSLTKIVKQKYPNLPYVFLGHSMGSYLLRQYLCIHGKELDGAIIMGTGDEPPLKLKGALAIIEKIASVKGWDYRSNPIDKTAFGGFNKKFKSRTHRDWLSRDPKQIDKYIADPKCSFVFTLNGYYNLVYGINKLNEDYFLNNMPKDLPILFLSGEDDPVGAFGKGPVSVFKKFNSLNMSNTNIKIYPEFRHEILNEIDNHIVYNDILNWLNSII